MDKKVILFDADGVVIQSEMFVNHILEVTGLPREEVIPFFTGVFQECMIGKADLKTEIKPWLKKWNWEEDVNGFLIQWLEYEDRIDQKMLNLVKELQKNSILCYLATNQEKYRTEYIRNEMGLGDVFDGIFSSAEIGIKKPKTEFFEFIIKTLDINKKEILYLDDTASHVAGAQAAGIESHLYTNYEDFYNYVKPLLKEAH